MQASLVMFKADGDRREFPISKASVVLGRKNTCDLRIPLSSVSRQHCQIEIRDDAVYLRDLGSSNGTFHNGERVMEASLEAGDHITVGDVHFTLLIDGQPSQVEAVPTVLAQDTESYAGNTGENSDSDDLVFAADDDEDDLALPVGQEITDPGDELEEVVDEPPARQPRPAPGGAPSSRQGQAAKPAKSAPPPPPLPTDSADDSGEDPISALEEMANFDDDDDDEPLPFDSDFR